MYEAFFNLEEKPFNLTPSHRFLYLSEGHKEALALLTYGVVERKGFILLSGDVGTGKTTLIQALLGNLGTDVECIHFSNPLLSPSEFIDYLASSTFKRRVHFKSKSDFLFEFEDYLRVAQQHQRAFILIIDEAQTLSLELLEEIRLLSNLESSEEKLINIFLVGQPELIDRLRDPRCRALYQRIASRYHLQPLNAEETGRYVTTRLEVAGAKDPKGIFPKRTIAALYRYSEGIPRTINILGDNALLLGYSRGKATITPKMIEASYQDMHLGEGDSPAAAEAVTGGASERVPEAEKRKGRKPALLKRLGWVFALLVALGVGALLAGVRVSDFRAFGGFLKLSDGPPSGKSVDVPVKPSPPARDRRPEPSSPNEPETVQTEKAGGLGSAGSAVEKEANMPLLPQSQAESDLRGSPGVGGEEGGKPIDSVDGPLGGGDGVGPAGATRMAVQEGDYLAKLAMKVYGRADEEVLQLIQEHNPDLKDVHRIEVGQVIVFPRIADPSGGRLYTVHVASYRPDESVQDAFRSLAEAGYEVFLVPFHSPDQGMLYRITVGSFSNREAAETYRREILARPEFTHAKVIQLDMDEQPR